jgi:hypothetical protein
VAVIGFRLVYVASTYSKIEYCWPAKSFNGRRGF